MSEWTVDDLTTADLGDIAWAGGPLHGKAVAEALGRAAAGEVDYLAVRGADGKPVAIGGVDHVLRADASTIWQLSVDPPRQCQGLGTILIKGLEARAVHRGATLLTLSVEDDNPRAQALYERLGYVAVGTQVESWNVQDEDGTIRLHTANCIVLDRPA